MAALSAYERLQTRIAEHRAQGWDTTALEAALAVTPKPPHVAQAEAAAKLRAYGARVTQVVLRVRLGEPGAMGELTGMIDAAMATVPGRGDDGR
jgi:hypothetical protein